MKKNYIRFMISDQEKEMIAKRAKEFNMNLSQFIRFMCIHGDYKGVKTNQDV